MNAQSGGARWGVYLVLNDTVEDMTGRAQYNRDLFDAPAIMCTVKDHKGISHAANSNPEYRLR